MFNVAVVTYQYHQFSVYWVQAVWLILRVMFVSRVACDTAHLEAFGYRSCTPFT